jgi:hypothetical protein
MMNFVVQNSPDQNMVNMLFVNAPSKRNLTDQALPITIEPAGILYPLYSLSTST